MTEQKAKANVNKMKHRVNHVTYGKLVDSLLYGVPLTAKQMTKAAEEIYNFFHDNGAGHMINDLVLKTKYQIDTEGYAHKVEAWLEDRNGRKLSHFDMANLIHRLYW